MSQKRVEISQMSRNEQCNEQDSRGGVDVKITMEMVAIVRSGWIWKGGQGVKMNKFDSS